MRPMIEVLEEDAALGVGEALSRLVDAPPAHRDEVSASPQQSALSRALLRAAVMDVLKRDRQWEAQARAWFEARGDGPCSFETVCAVLGVQAEFLREEVLRARSARERHEFLAIVMRSQRHVRVRPAWVRGRARRG